MSKEQEKFQYVNITPLKRPRASEQDDEDDDDTLGHDDEVDAYKGWLEEKGPHTGIYAICTTPTTCILSSLNIHISDSNSQTYVMTHGKKL